MKGFALIILYTFFFILSIDSQAQNCSSHKMVAFYPFNGNMEDESGNLNHGTSFGPILTTDRHGKPGLAYEFNGNSDYIFVASSPTLGLPEEEITVAGWIYVNGRDGFFSIVCKTGYLNFSADYRVFNYWENAGPVNNLNILQNGTQATFDHNFPINEWFHFAVTGVQNNYRIFKNGEFIGTTTNSNNFFVIDKDTDLYIGVDPHGNLEYHKGKLDEIRIYDCALSDNQIKNIYETEADSSIVAVTQSGLNEKSVNIYPNPTNGKLNIVLPTHNSLQITYEIFDATGKATKLFVQNRKTFTEIDVQHLANGIYFLHLKYENKVPCIVRFVVNHE